jgi:hypothetical protein
VASATANPGEIVSVKISVSNCVDAKSVRIVPTYDSSVLEIVSGNWLVNGILSDNWSETFGDALITFTQNTSINTDIFELTFRVKDTAQGGAVANVGCQIVIKTMDGKEEKAVQTVVNSGTITVAGGKTGVCVSGTVTSYITTGDVTIKLYPAGSATASYTATVSAGNNTPAAYVIEDVEPGAYTMEVSKDKHATRTYSVTVGTADVTLDAKICPKGDISQDGKVNAKDYKLILQHVNKSKFLTDYALECAKINNDANVNAKDMKLMLQHINKSKPLF